MCELLSLNVEGVNLGSVNLELNGYPREAAILDLDKWTITVNMNASSKCA